MRVGRTVRVVVAVGVMGVVEVGVWVRSWVGLLRGMLE